MKWSFWVDIIYLVNFIQELCHQHNGVCVISFHFLWKRLAFSTLSLKEFSVISKQTSRQPSRSHWAQYCSFPICTGWVNLSQFLGNTSFQLGAWFFESQVRQAGKQWQRKQARLRRSVWSCHLLKAQHLKSRCGIPGLKLTPKYACKQRRKRNLRSEQGACEDPRREDILRQTS